MPWRRVLPFTPLTDNEAREERAGWTSIVPWCRTSTLFLAIRRPCCSIEGIDRLNQANEPRLTRRCREILNDETSSVKMSPFPRQAKGWKPGITYAALTVFAQFPVICWTAQSTQFRFCRSLVAACMHAASVFLTERFCGYGFTIPSR